MSRYRALVLNLGRLRRSAAGICLTAVTLVACGDTPGNTRVANASQSGSATETMGATETVTMGGQSMSATETTTSGMGVSDSATMVPTEGGMGVSDSNSSDTMPDDTTTGMGGGGCGDGVVDPGEEC